MRKFLLVVVLAALASAPGCRYVKNADDTAFDEFSASSMLKKYEFFHDASAKLDAKLASIQVAEARLKALEKQYQGVARKDWARTDAEQSSVWSQEIAGLKMSFNALAAVYNSRMSKENYAFCNVGDMPKGLPAGAKPLPREFKTYLND